MEVRSLLLRFENLNRLCFQPFLTSINPLSMEEHISAMLCPGTWGTHIEILAAATYYNVAVYYCCHSAKKGHHWERCQPLQQPKHGFHYIDLSGSALEHIAPPHHFELAYTTNCHYDSIISLTGNLCTDFPPLSNEIIIIPGIVQ